MTDLILNLLKIQSLDFHEPGEVSESQRDELRGTVPQPVLAHYDRLVARGKKGVAIVRNQVCTGCHMRLPIGTINTLMQHQDIQLCDSCGRYLYLFPETAPAASEPASASKVATKPARKPRKKKATAPAEA